jgi:hypothetical protein
MTPRLASILAACVTLAAACAAEPRKDADAERSAQPVYRTGSNIPAGRESNAPPSEMSAADRKALEDWQLRPRLPKPPSGGAN